MLAGKSKATGQGLRLRVPLGFRVWGLLSGFLEGARSCLRALGFGSFGFWDPGWSIRSFVADS